MRKINLIFSVALIAILAACSPNASPTVSPEDIDKALNAVRTEISQTLSAESAQNPTATALPVIPTIAPTQELLPSSTPLPTATSVVLPTQIPATPTPLPTEEPKAIITILAIEKNKAISVQADNFPANQVFKIRVGPFDTFFKDYVEVGTINSGNGGTFKFSVLLPDTVKDVERVTVRLDSTSGIYAYNYFKNSTSGTISADATPVTSPLCTISTSPNANTVMDKGYDFDAVWTIKNTSGSTWDSGTLDYKYIRGSELHKYKDIYDLNVKVESGDKVTVKVDMLAPNNAGTYSTNWALVQGNKVICNLPLTIVVK